MSPGGDPCAGYRTVLVCLVRVTSGVLFRTSEHRALRESNIIHNQRGTTPILQTKMLTEQSEIKLQASVEWRGGRQRRPVNSGAGGDARYAGRTA